MQNTLPGGKLFFSVERFDYTKGIKEKLLAFEKYFETYPDRIGKDVFYQIAPYNRQSIRNYSEYQVCV
jgi:trehalose-6-phosphate synthase